MKTIYIYIALLAILTGCIKTEGTLRLKGKVIDEFTKIEIPKREIIVQALLESNNKLVPINAGNFSTDSSGYFIYSLRKVKDARYYNFCIVGDSNYASSMIRLNLVQLAENSKYLFFSLSKLVDLTIQIQKKSKPTVQDTLYLSWESNKVDFRTLYPYTIDNYGLTESYNILIPSLGLRWIGGNINSTIKTKVFADKNTIIHWELVRNKRRNEFSDTIMCQRNVAYIVDFRY